MSQIPQLGNGDNINKISENLLKERIVFLGTAIDDDAANTIVAQLLFLSENSTQDIFLYINSPGGSVTAGMAIYDTIQHIKAKADIATVCVGLAASMAAIILSAGTKYKRMALPDSRIMINKPVGGTQIANIETQAIEIERIRQILSSILATSTGQSVERIYHDTENDYFMTSIEAKEYGIVDKRIYK